ISQAVVEEAELSAAITANAAGRQQIRGHAQAEAVESLNGAARPSPAPAAAVASGTPMGRTGGGTGFEPSSPASRESLERRRIWGKNVERLGERDKGAMANGELDDQLDGADFQVGFKFARNFKDSNRARMGRMRRYFEQFSRGLDERGQPRER